MQRVENPREWADQLDRPLDAQAAGDPTEAELDHDAENFAAFASMMGSPPPPPTA